MSKHHGYFASREWQGLRIEAIARDGGRCTICSKAGRFEIHHIVYLKNGGLNTLNNLTTLCRDCHLGIHKKDNPRLYTTGWEKLVEELIDG